MRTRSPLRVSELFVLLAIAIAFAIALFVTKVFVVSLVHQILIAIVASLAVHLMLQMNLLNFAVPGFMAIGGYASAILTRNGATDVVLQLVAAFVVPSLVAVALGTLVLRLRGTFFVLVTFAFAEIVQLLIFELPDWTGGAQGLTDLSPATLLSIAIETNQQVFMLAVIVSALALVITAVAARYFEDQFSAIRENEVLAESLGLAVWRYKAIGFSIAGGLSGLGGFLLVNMLITAHPSSFASLSSVTYISYAIIGGFSSLAGPVLGCILLVTASNLFSASGEFSQGMFGLLLMVVTLVARGGLVGLFEKMWAPRRAPARSKAELRI
jgi:branched-chain amino acid transport system permease protein